MMKTINFLTFLFLVTIASYSYAGVIVLEGNYMGKNLFVKNPYGGSGVGYCVYEVTINGRLSPDEVNQAAFEIDLKNFNLKLGEKVVINIKHKDDCSPEVLNPEVLKAKSTFNIDKIAFTDDGILKWTANNETGKLEYIVEQFRWNKWVKVGETEGVGTPGVHDYSFKITPHSGTNKARVKQIDYTNKARYSQSAEYKATVPQITIDGDKFKGVIDFTGGKTLYEIYDRYGTIVKKGYSEKVDINEFKKGTYYLSYDNTTKTVFIK